MYFPYGYPAFYMPHIPSSPVPIPYRNSASSCLQTAIQHAAEAVQGEREDEWFYQYLISIAPTQEQQDIIASIRDDERKHNQMFRQIYRDFTGQGVQPSHGEEAFAKPESYLKGIQQALFGELSAVERYRVIWQCLPEGQYRDMLFEIITDELKHASKYNFLFTLNK